MNPEPSDSRLEAPRRGAPRGNLNALKHGYYSRLIHEGRLHGSRTHNEMDLSEEITMLRAFIRRFTGLINHASQLGSAMDLLHGLCLAIATLNRLVRTQELVQPHPAEIEIGYRLALEEVTHELGIDLPPEEGDQPQLTASPPAGQQEVTNNEQPTTNN